MNAYAREKGQSIRARPTVFEKNRDEDQVDNLKNKEAEYMVIRPLTEGFSVDTVMELIFEQLGSRESLRQEGF